MTLYREILGDRFALLPPAVQALHDHPGEAVYAGTCYVKRGTNLCAHLLADLLSLPKASPHAEVTVRFQTRGDTEIWERHFNGRKFKSLQWQEGELLYEHIPFTTLVFRVNANSEKLALELQHLLVFSIFKLRWFIPQVIAEEREVEGKFQFFISTTLPFLGLLIEYQGTLDAQKRA